jgi:hypothetical protein
MMVMIFSTFSYYYRSDECRQQLSAVAALLKKVNNTAANFKAASGRNTKVDSEVQTDAYNKQKDW